MKHIGPIGCVNSCPNCGMGRLQMDKIISVDGAYTDNLYIYQKVKGHCKLCGTKLQWKTAYLHGDDSEIVIDEEN